MTDLTHIDAEGRLRKVDVSAKGDTLRTAVATGSIAIRPDALRLSLGGAAPKGPVEGIAEIAGVMAAKKTACLIPLCHPLTLSRIDVAVVPTAAG